MTGAAIPSLTGYSATITVAKQGVANIGGIPAIPANQALLISVTVTGPADTVVALHAYRMRYAPNALP
jgi:MSHA pilin protein MshD